MDQSFFTNLPTVILINILSRLPIPTITTCKSVCKSWLDLIKSDDFIIFHLSKSGPGLAVLGCNIFELVDGPNIERHQLHYSPVADFDHTAFISRPNPSIYVKGSANGLILLWDYNGCYKYQSLYVLNPITRDYIELEFQAPKVPESTLLRFGFGVRKLSGQYKVVRISHDYADTHTVPLPKSECWVYTIGTGSWRSVELGHELYYTCFTHGMFLHGNLHWLVSDYRRRRRISCFDLETEVFSSFVPAPACGDLFVLRGCLCMTDYPSSSDDKLAFWLMKEYGVEKSWVKEFAISRYPFPVFEREENVYPVKFFENGDVLMAYDYCLFYYSLRTKTTHRVNITALDRTMHVQAIACVPSFLSLTRFGTENVRLF